MIKKFTLLLLFVVAFSWQGTAQLTEDFEGGMVSLVNATGNSTDFALVTTLFHGGTQSVRNTYANSETNILEQAATMDLSGTTNPLLTFWHIAKTEGTYDKCYVEISTDGGTTYSTLTESDYLGSASDYTANEYFHEDSYTEWGTDSTISADNTWWKKEEFLLTEYIGSNVKIRFQLTSDGSLTREGWYIDDVTVTDPQYISPIATFTAVNDCTNNQFTVDVDVTSLGGATSVTIEDDQSNTMSVSATGVVNFGPYPVGTTVAFTVTNDDDGTYTSGDSVTFNCPPANDDMAGATPITPSADGTTCDSSSYTFQAWLGGTYVTDSGMDSTCNNTNTGLDVFYTWTATSVALVFNAGDGGPGIAIRDTSGNEITCEQTISTTDIILSGWTVGDDLIIQIYDYSTDDVDVSFCLAEKTTINPIATYTAVNDCTNNQFTVDVDVTNLGGATSVTVEDDQGSASQSVSATGVVTFGPYPVGTTVAFTITNDTDNSYTSGDSLTFVCPPANDACADATGVDTLPYTESVDATGATNNDGFITACTTNGMNDGIWYTFTVVTAGTITITATPTDWDPEIGVYTGSCGALTCVDRVDNGGSGTAETYDLTAEEGTQYWVNIGYFSSITDGSEGPVDVSITTTDGATLVTLATQDAQIIAGLAYYPNPVNNQLSLRANNTIDQVEVLNILGQTVLTAKPSATSTAIDMTALSQGTYFVRVQANGAIQTVKVIKN